MNGLVRTIGRRELEPSPQLTMGRPASTGATLFEDATMATCCGLWFVLLDQQTSGSTGFLVRKAVDHVDDIPLCEFRHRLSTVF